MLPDFVEKNLARQSRALGIKSCGPAIDVVVAGPAGRQFELAQAKRLVGEQLEQFLARSVHQI